jgi:glutamate-ammonia-ligase adenylyltransferase
MLVSSIDAFRAYQKESAWTWEAQALTRARPVTGDDELMEQFEQIRLESLCRPRDRDVLTLELREMRQKIRESHGAGSTPELAVKHAPGGLVDIGFIAQLGVLAEGSQSKKVARDTGAAEQISSLREAGWLNETQEKLLQSHLHALRKCRTRLELDTQPSENDRALAEQGEAVAALFRRLTGE